MNTKLEQAARQALEALEPIHHGNMTPMAEFAWKDAITALREALEEVPQPAAVEQESAWIANDWSVFNTGAEVASGLSLKEAMDYLTDERAARGWSVVCVINKDNMPTPAAPQPTRQPLKELPDGDIVFFSDRGDAVTGYSVQRVWEILRSNGIGGNHG